MTTNPWEPSEATFNAANADIRAWQDEVLAEYQRQQAIQAVSSGGLPPDIAQRFPLAAQRSGGVR